MTRILLVIISLFMLAACAEKQSITADNINNALLFKNNDPFVLNEDGHKAVISIIQNLSDSNLNVCKCIPEPYKATLENTLKGNAVQVEFKKPIQIKIPPKGEFLETSKVLIGTGSDRKTIGFEVRGNYVLYASTNEFTADFEKMIKR